MPEPSARPRIAAVIFDMDGVLVDSEPLWEEAERAFIAGHGRAYDHDFFRGTMGWGMREFMTRVRRRYELDASVDSLRAELTERLLALLPDRLRILPGADALLSRAAAGYPCALASGSPRAVIEAVVRRFQWEPFLPVRCSADDVARGKPAPDLFLRAAAALGVPPPACLVIEDSPAGVQAARAAGMHCIGLVTPGRVPAEALQPFADRLVDRLADIDPDRL